MEAMTDHSPAPEVIYFSSVSDNTHRFVTKLGLPSQRIPLHTAAAAQLVAQAPYVLILPTYGQAGEGGHIPRQVHAFLKSSVNRERLTGVVGCGNTNFGADYTIAVDLIREKFAKDLHRDIPILGRVELMGTPEDVEQIRERLIRHRGSAADHSSHTRRVRVP